MPGMGGLAGRTAFVIVMGILALGCSSGRVVTRVDTEEQIDLSGRWNDVDSRQVSQAMIMDCLNHPWLGEFMRTGGSKPAVIVGSIRNKSQEHIPVGTFINDIERAFINSGDVRVVASVTERDELRAERLDQRANATPESLKKMGRESGADFMMLGEINQIIDSEGGKKVSYYQVNLTLITIESNEKVWIGDKKIKKFISQSRYKG